MGTRGISAIAGASLVGMAFEPTTILVKLAYRLFGAAAGSIVGKTIEAEAVNVKKQLETKMKNNAVGWFEIYVQDLDRAKSFYESVFQLKLDKLNSPGMEMWTFPTEWYGVQILSTPHP